MAIGFFKKATPNSMTQDAPNPFKVCLAITPFTECYLKTIWTRVIQNTLRRCVFKSKDADEIMRTWGFSAINGVGLIDYVADAMVRKSVISLKYESGIVRLMTESEKEEFENSNKTQTGMIELDFSDFHKTDIATFYIEQLFYLNQARMTQWGVASSLILKLNGVREMVSTGRCFDSENASNIARAIRKGKVVELDGGDYVGGADNIHNDVIINGRDAIISELACAIDLPKSFITRETTTGGLSVDAETDVISESEALESYYYSICEPIMRQLYGVQDLTYRNDRYSSLESKLRSLAMLETSEYWSKQTDEEKAKIWDELLGLQDSNNSSS